MITWQFGELDMDDPKTERRLCEMLDNDWVPFTNRSGRSDNEPVVLLRKEIYL